MNHTKQLKREDINKNDLLQFMNESEIIYATRPNKKITITLEQIFCIYTRVNGLWAIISCTKDIKRAVSDFNKL